jgi:hypothetical protein
VKGDAIRIAALLLSCLALASALYTAGKVEGRAQCWELID